MIDEGEKEGSSFIHFKNFFGYQTWMQVSFKTTYDDRGRISGALFAAVDVTNFMNVMDKYEGLLRRYDNNVADNRSAFRINLSENNLLAYSLNNGLPQVPSSVKTGDEFFMFLLENISAPDERMADLKDTLTVKNAIDRIDIGTEVIEEELYSMVFNKMNAHRVTPRKTCKQVSAKKMVGNIPNFKKNMKRIL